MRPYGRLLLAIAILRAILGAAVLLLFDPEDPVRLVSCLVILAFAQLSDHIDGWIARRLSTPNLSGYLQDSVSDKLFHLGCLLGFATYFDWLSPAVWLICCREFVILALRVATPNVALLMKSYKWQSILYAICLRCGIAMLLITLLAFSQPSLMTVLATHLLIYVAAFVGIINIGSVFRGSRRSYSQQPEPG